MSDITEDIESEETKQSSKLLMLAILFAAIAVIATPILIARTFYGEYGISRNAYLTQLALPGLSLLIMLLAVIFLKKTRITGAPDFIWYRWNRSEVIKAILLILAVPTVYLITGALIRKLGLQLKPDLWYLAGQQGLAFFVILTIFIAFIGPFMEEIFWRGCVQTTLERIVGMLPALLAQAVLFGAIHLRPLGGFINIFLFGLIAGLWRWRRKTLLPIIIAHMTLNSLWCAVHWPNWLEYTKIKIKHDYIAEFIELSKPDAYNPNEDAREEYTKANRLVIEIPKELEETRQRYPTQWSQEEQARAEAWLASNTLPLDLIEKGTQKAYYWNEYKRLNERMPVLPRNLDRIKHVIFLMCMRATLRASQGQIDQGFSDIETCIQFGRHLVANKDLLLKLIGWACYGNTLQSTRLILAHENIDHTLVTSLQSQFEMLAVQDNFECDFTAERLLLMDAIQCMFTDDGKGGGYIPEIALRIPRSFQSLIPEFSTQQKQALLRLERRQTTIQVERYCDILEKAFSLSPWQYERDYDGVKTSIEQIKKENPLIKTFSINLQSLHIAARSRVVFDAMITILGLLRYKADTQQFPESLSQLILLGYLKAVPDDPYSDGPIVYKRTDDSFTLYSFGADFDDDGGTPSKWGEGKKGGDQVFWPVEGTNGYIELLSKVKE